MSEEVIRDQRRILTSFEDGNWLYSEYFGNFAESLCRQSDGTEAELDPNMIHMFKLHWFYWRLEDSNEIKRTGQEIWNFYFFHRVTLRRKMAKFRQALKRIFDAHTLVEGRVIERISAHTCSPYYGPSAEEIASMRANRVFNELLLYGIVLRKIRPLRCALVILLSRTLGLGREWFRNLKFEDLPKDGSKVLTISRKALKGRQMKIQKIELSCSIADSLTFLRKVIFQLVLEKNTNTRTIIPARLFKRKESLKDGWNRATFMNLPIRVL